MEELFAPGHRGCAGCGAAIAARLILKGAGKDIIAVSPTGCLEVISSPYPQSSWGVPWIHSLFENAAAVASGIEAALRALGREDEAKVLAIAGDGGTIDIGFGVLSGMLERGHDVTYICYDNEAYMNTGIQRSGSTPYGASTTTSPAGKVSFGEDRPKKNAPAIAAAHGIPYVATASIAYPKDVIKKVKKAVKIKGPKYLQIHAPCCTGWGFDSSRTIEVGRLAVETALFPIYEMQNGKITSVKKIKRKPVEEYLKVQRRFRHLFEKEGGEEEIKKIQEIADGNAEQFGLDL
ncbi:MAG: pyruvate synthase subunit PorB [Methanocellales archaeon]|nr:pyruvate synthase subunit PorB [Methanocellales archaeon]